MKRLAAVSVLCMMVLTLTCVYAEEPVQPVTESSDADKNKGIVSETKETIDKGGKALAGDLKQGIRDVKQGVKDAGEAARGSGSRIKSGFKEVGGEIREGYHEVKEGVKEGFKGEK